MWRGGRHEALSGDDRRYWSEDLQRQCCSGQLNGRSGFDNGRSSVSWQRSDNWFYFSQRLVALARIFLLHETLSRDRRPSLRKGFELVWRVTVSFLCPTVADVQRVRRIVWLVNESPYSSSQEFRIDGLRRRRFSDIRIPVLAMHESDISRRGWLVSGRQ